MGWTKEQEQVIAARGCNLLVSAAAGSGKTAVLVERIITRLTEGENPLDSDAVRNLPDREGLHVRSSSANLDDDAPEALKPELVTFLDLVGDSDSVAGLEPRIARGLVLGEHLLY